MLVDKDVYERHLLLLGNAVLQTLFYDYDGISGDRIRPFGRAGMYKISVDILQIIEMPPDGEINNVTGHRFYSEAQLKYAERLWGEVLPFMQSRCELRKKECRQD